MKISTKGRYAIKLMLDLATYYNGEPVKIKDIARRQHISDKYLEQIVAILNKASLVKSVRGARGGYMLYASPENYTVRQILETVEGSLVPADCVGDNAAYCENRSMCVSVLIWEKLDQAIQDVLEGITLADRSLSLKEDLQALRLPFRDSWNRALQCRPCRSVRLPYG